MSTRDLTVLLADVSGSSRIYEKLGDAEALRAIDRCLNRVERAAVAHKGRVVKAIGNEVMAVFASAEDAALAAGDMRQRIDDLPPISGVKLAIRISIRQEAAPEEGNDRANAPAAPPDARLRLRHGGAEIILGPDRPTALLGRDNHCDIVILDSRASRNHGRIERRRDKYVLVDQSTNGTYVTPQGEPEFVLKREEAILRGRGRIAFGHSHREAGPEILEFDILD
ncbi:MAG: FHA domain-containing protein [Rhodocyclaceae bacterium]|nr:FHA domain-containing protein [Rhodocyclaceae bacterium]